MENKTLSILRIGGIALLALVFLGVVRRNQQTTHLEELELPVALGEEDRIERTIVLDDTDYALMEGDFLPKLAYDDPTGTNGLLSDLNDINFASIYEQAKRGDDMKRQFTILQDIYAETMDPQLLPYLVNLALQVRDYSLALSYVQVLEQQETLFEVLDPSTFFVVLFNGLELTFKDITHIKELMSLYAGQQRISQEQVDVWSALITYVRGDMDNYAYFMDQLSGTVYDQWHREYLGNVTASQSYVDVPAYYLEGLTALQVFSHGYYQVARLAAKRIIALDERYMLPRQIYGYASMMMGDWRQVVHQMERLRDHDADNEQLYTFLAGVAHIQLEQYPEAVLLLREVHDSRYVVDAQRYLLLAYEMLGEYDDMAILFEQFIVYEQILPHDFYTIFDLFFYKPLRESKDTVLYTKYFAVALRYIDACYTRLGQEYAYICLWGKSGLMLANDEGEKAYRYLQRLVKRYPKDFLYEALGDFAYENGLYDDAKKRFTYSLAQTDEVSMKQGLIQKIRSTVVESE